jgi:hypothetical protein
MRGPTRIFWASLTPFSLQCYIRASGLFPVDDLHRLTALERAMECVCQAGGWAPPELQAMVDDYHLSKKCAKLMWGTECEGFSPSEADATCIFVCAQALQSAQQAWDATPADAKPAESFEEWRQPPFFVEMRSEEELIGGDQQYFVMDDATARQYANERSVPSRQRESQEFRSVHPSEAASVLREDVDQAAPVQTASKPATAPTDLEPPAELLDPLTSALMVDLATDVCFVLYINRSEAKLDFNTKTAMAN